MATGDVTHYLIEAANGNEIAQVELWQRVYNELRRLARGYMRGQRPNHTLQPTALVNEAYLRLLKGSPIDWKDRTHFFAVAAKVMRRVLVDYERERLAQKRGGDRQRVALDLIVDVAGKTGGDLLVWDEALGRLEQHNERQARIVELRVLVGLQEDEIAQHLGISTRTVRRDWNVAKARLYRETQKGAAKKPSAPDGRHAAHGKQSGL